MVNGNSMNCFVDLGSQCTMIKYSNAKNIITEWSRENLPVLRGFGNSIVSVLGKSFLEIEIDSVKAKVCVLIVPDEYLSIPLLVGQTYTEQEHVIIHKTSKSLKIVSLDDNNYNKFSISLFVKNSVTVDNLSEIEVYSKPEYDGDVFVEYSMRQKPNEEYEVIRAIIALKGGNGKLFVKRLSKNEFKLDKNLRLARAVPAYESKEYLVNRIENSTNVHVEIIDQDIIKVDQSIGTENIQRLIDLLNNFRKCFAFSVKELGCCKLTEMDIQLHDKTPVVYRPYRLSYSEREVVRDILKELEDSGIIRESCSEYASPILLVKKKTGDYRLCIDFRSLNKKTIKDHYPLPRIDDQLDSLSGFRYYTTLDLSSGYYQIPLSEQSKHLTAFITPDGHFEFNRMPFGLTNAPSNFQRTINKVLGNARFKHAFAYMDDIIIPSVDIDDGFKRLHDILKLFNDAGLTLNLNKCNFFKKSIEYLGFEIDESGIKPGLKKIEAVEKFPTPVDQHKVRQFIGLASFFRRFVRNFSTIAKPLTTLLKKDVKFMWGESQDHAFKTLKLELVKRPILTLYNPSFETQLHTDASKIGVAGILLQRKNKDFPLQPVAYFSRQTSPEESYFTSYDLETLAVVSSLESFRVYLIGIHFTIVTDCNSLRATFEKKDILPRVARWWNILQEYDFSIVYKPGSLMSHVDALSRNPVFKDTLEVRNISTDWIVTVQQNDSEIQRIVNILKDVETNNAVEIDKNFAIKRDLLYRKTDNGLKWVVPKGVRWQILKSNHDDVGHFSFDKTLDKIKSSYWFPRMRRFIKKYVDSCLECAHAKAPSVRTGKLHPIEKIPQPFHTVHIDHLGPFVPSSRKNTHLLLIIDAFTKFIILAPVRSTKSSQAMNVLKNYFHTFGVPKRLISDRSTSFTSKRFKEFLNQLGIKHILNAVATPRANGQIERYNRTLLTSLTAAGQGKSERLWDQHISEIQWGLNNTLNKGIGKTPAQTLFGINPTGMSDSLLRLQVVSEDETDREKLREEVSVCIQKNQAQQKERYDKGRKNLVFKEGDLVRIEREIQATGQSRKLIPKLRGPYRVMKVLGNDRYEVQDTPISRKGNKPFRGVFSVDKMYPWLVFKRSENLDSSSSDSEISQ